MGPRRVTVLLEIETDLPLSALGRRARWTHQDAEMEGAHWEVQQVEVNGIQDGTPRREKSGPALEGVTDSVGDGNGARGRAARPPGVPAAGPGAGRPASA